MEPADDPGDALETADRPSRSGKLPLPSTNPATNLAIAAIIVRGASTLLRENIEERIVKASAADPREAENVLDGRTLITTLALYGASKLATRSGPGLALVTGALVLKTLYDRGKARQLREKRQERDGIPSNVAR